MKLNELKIEITDKCLLNCVHCSTNARKTHATFLPLYYMFDAIRQAAEMGCSSVQLSGGEPFLDPYW